MRLRVVLGLWGRMERPLGQLLHLQQVQRVRRLRGRQAQGPEQGGAGALPALLHALHQPPQLAQAGGGHAQEDGGQDPRDAEPGQQHLARCAVPQGGGGGAPGLPPRAAVHLRLRLLPLSLQPQGALRDGPARPGDDHRGPLRGDHGEARGGDRPPHRAPPPAHEQEAAREPLQRGGGTPGCGAGSTPQRLAAVSRRVAQRSLDPCAGTRSRGCGTSHH
mmetsp:Transcript_14932/g.43846  ORF Transcript_14932/g.43846 Transcript_14932/m.43846 type:complete len:219 (+) Transcript_14932:984-1640(+)